MYLRISNPMLFPKLPPRAAFSGSAAIVLRHSAAEPYDRKCMIGNEQNARILIRFLRRICAAKAA